MITPAHHPILSANRIAIRLALDFWRPRVLARFAADAFGKAMFARRDSFHNGMNRKQWGGRLPVSTHGGWCMAIELIMTP